MKTVYLGIGSNIGNPASQLRRAIRALALPRKDLSLRRLSPFYESEALLPPGAPASWNQPFLNCVVECETKLAPLDLLTQIKKIEQTLGRAPRERWAPREIDIDILAFADDLEFQSDQLQIPHAALRDRPFALLPLCDLAPQLLLPGKSKTERPLTCEDLARPWRQRTEAVPFRTQRSSVIFSELIGILNLTPDSFSDGGQIESTERALHRTQELMDQGASVIDLGAESTRPNSQPISIQLELSRLHSILPVLRRTFPHLPLSLDTRQETVARWAAEHGVHWINDVTGFHSAALQQIVRDFQLQGVFMHSLGVPPKPAVTLDPLKDPVRELLQWGHERLLALKDASQDTPAPETWIFDPGIGFGKSPEQSFEILRSISTFRELGVPLLVGHSRKSFLKKVTSRQPHERDLETSALSLLLAKQGVDYLRVHNVEMTRRAIQAGLELDGVVVWRNP